MATYNRVHAVHGINRYLWSRIKAAGILTEVPKGNARIVPIIPTEEAVQLIEAIDAMPGVQSYPFIVYNWSYNSSEGTNWYLERNLIAYLIRSDDQNKLGQLINLITDELQEFDVSAEKVNDFIYGTPNIPEEMKKYLYKSISVDTAGGPLPIDTEGAPSQAMITISVLFTKDKN